MTSKNRQISDATNVTVVPEGTRGQDLKDEGYDVLFPSRMTKILNMLETLGNLGAPAYKDDRTPEDIDGAEEDLHAAVDAAIARLRKWTPKGRRGYVPASRR